MDQKLRNSTSCACAVEIWPKIAQNDWRDVVQSSGCSAFTIATFSSFLLRCIGMHTQSSNENSVRLSVKCVNCNKMEEKSVQIFIPHEISFSLVF